MPIEHLKWERTGRKYRVLDDQGQAIPNRYVWTGAVGERNVDVQGDGSEFAPYHLDATRLRHGDSECEFASGFQTIRRLGQTLVSRSRLFVQRYVSGTWTDVPHGLPTRNVAHDYPREGRCTAYLDFPDIQGYASGARLQIGIEVGGNDKEVYGFRLRSPVAGTFRVEWILDIPDNWPIDPIHTKENLNNPDSPLVLVGGKVGPFKLRWTTEESPYRQASIVDDGQGGKAVRLVLGPYTLAAMEWLTIYPDTWGPTETGDDCCSYGGTYYDAYATDYLMVGNYYNAVCNTGWIWTGVTAQGTANDGCKIEIDSGGAFSSGGCTANLEIVDSNAPTAWGAANKPENTTRLGTVVAWNTPTINTNSLDSPEIKTIIQAWLDEGYGDGDDGMAICWMNNGSANNYGNFLYAEESWKTGARLTIDYTEGGAEELTLTCDLGTVTVPGAAAGLTASRLLSGAAGTVTASGEAAGLLVNRLISAEPITITVEGQAAGLTAFRLLTCDLGVVTVEGQDVGMLAERVLTLSADLGTVVVSGEAATLLAHRVLGGDLGTVTLEGQAAGLLTNRRLGADLGTVTVTGQDMGFNLAGIYIFALDPGTATVQGQAAGLLANRLLTGAVGSATASGEAAGLYANRLLSAGAGQAIISGQDARLLYNRILSAETGSYVVSGQDAALRRILTILAEAGAATVTGQDATLLWQHILNGNLGTVTINGQSVDLRILGRAITTHTSRTVIIAAENRTIIIPAESRIIVIPAETRTVTVH